VACLRFNSRVLNPAQTYYKAPYKEDSPNKVQQHEEEEEQQKEQEHQERKNHVNSVEYQRVEALRRPAQSYNEKHQKQYLYGIQHISHIPHHRRHYHHHSHQSNGQKHKPIVIRDERRISPIVVPQDRIPTKSHQVAERMKDPRLKGADLYVARLGRTYMPSTAKRADNADEETASGEKSGARALVIANRPLTGSLHDELRFPHPSKKPQDSLQAPTPCTQASATHSRPCKQPGPLPHHLLYLIRDLESHPGLLFSIYIASCGTTLKNSRLRRSNLGYRCISYMHSAGIKRVFWTNSQGEWEGGKVRDLIDDIESPSIDDNGDNGENVRRTPVFVTKAEVLILKGLNG